MESTKNTLLLLVSPPQQSAPGPEKNTPDSNDADQEPPVQCILPELGRLRLSRYIYQQEPYTLTTLPLDIVLLIADKLQAVDRTMLWLTCSAFHASISMKGYHPLDCPLARTRALRLLYNSPLLPYFGHNSKFLCRTRSRMNLRKLLDSQMDCGYCRYYSKMGQYIQCPFHPPIERQPPSLSLFRQFCRYQSQLRALTNSRSLTLESYIELSLPGLIHRFRHFNVLHLNSMCSQSWKDELRDMALVYQARVREYQRSNSLSPSIYQDEPTKWASEKWRKEHGAENIWPIVICNHCLNALPNNSPCRGPCVYCGCDACGWSEPKVLRVCDPKKAPTYIILGKITSSSMENETVFGRENGRGAWQGYRNTLPVGI